MKALSKIKLDEKYYNAIGRIFTPVVMDSLVQKGNSGYLSEVCTNSGLIDKIDLSMNLGQFFDCIYSILFKNYRNEYIYKNTIANKILLGKHSLNTSHMLTEFRVGKCKADAVVLNGTSTVYEIKSELDSFARLEKQIQAYMSIFDRINVITSDSQANKLKSFLPQSVGILVLTDRNTISTIREPESNKNDINQSILFDSFRKSEYIKAIKLHFGTVPNVPNTKIFRECKKLFCEIPPDVAHDLMVKILRERSNSMVLKEFIDRAPNSLSAYAISICNEKAKLQKLISLLSSKLSSVIIPELT